MDVSINSVYFAASCLHGNSPHHPHVYTYWRWSPDWWERPLANFQ